ncbi:mediator of RNA polymerase II transcription subunit 6 isoform X5 [Cherax quadricarinatus]|uniref:mediator of RNA polymerase II transcription subunit 6 isoform X5 n=1 Tax=Cherax quadricarinatus TaxID=27406 RepID=UPI002377E86C|nr:mediator of RNA polymerase II transcription subunit 6-like isoform X4 [Cherax quadricarinatus]
MSLAHGQALRVVKLSKLFKADNPLHISWHDSMWVPHLNSTNIMDYFSERTNPFYSRDCNNEFIKMQQNTRVDQLTHMQGVEYMLLHTQEPILYIIRKQQRFSPTQLAAVSNLTSAFTELQSFSHYHLSRGYWWQFRNQMEQTEQQKRDKEKKAGQGKREEPASMFQHRRVGSLLEDLQVKFPYKFPTQAQQPAQQQPQQQPQQQSQQQQQPQQSQQQTQQQEGIKTEDCKADIKTEIKTEVKVEVKTEPVSQPPAQRTAKPPPEKRQRTGP